MEEKKLDEWAEKHLNEKQENEDFFLTATSGDKGKINHYKRVAHLIPKKTSTMLRVLTSLARNELMKDQAFKA